MNDRNAIGFGIVGCGHAALRHAQSLQDLSGAKFIVATDIIASKAQTFARDFGCAVADDYSVLLDRQDVDVVSICTPSGLHARMGIEAANAGKHVLVEKPIALSLEEADALIEACARAKVKLGVVLQNRYNAPVLTLRQAVDENRLGKLLLGAAVVRWFRPQEYYEDGWHGTWTLDGGVLINQAYHFVDMLQWFFGEVESVFAYTATMAHQTETPDVGIGLLRFKSGSLATIEASTVVYPSNVEGSLSLFGQNGSVKIGGTALNLIEFWKVAGEADPHQCSLLTPQESAQSSVYGSSHHKVISDMVTAVCEDREPNITGKVARKSLEIVLALYKAARMNKEVRL